MAWPFWPLPIPLISETGHVPGLGVEDRPSRASGEGLRCNILARDDRLCRALPVIAAPVHQATPEIGSITRAQQAGHWALDGADWKWVPPETLLRPVQTAPRVSGQYVWRDQRYVWVPAHYAD
jgi:hypothetical protein